MEKTDTARLRLTPDEKVAFQEAADIAGLSLSAWIRERLRKASASELERAGYPIPFYQNRRSAA